MNMKIKELIKEEVSKYLNESDLFNLSIENKTKDGYKYRIFNYSFEINNIEYKCVIYPNIWQLGSHVYDAAFIKKDGTTKDRIGKDLKFMNRVLKTVAECIIDFISKNEKVKKIRFQSDKIRENAYIRFFRNHPFFSKYDIDNTFEYSNFVEININKGIIKEEVSKLLNESSNIDLLTFLSNKKFINPKSKEFLFHGTKISPENFNLRDDYEWEDSNIWSGDLPEGYLFLTTSIQEASAYGKYIMPCELEYYDNITFKIDGNNPSQVFDMDYGIDLYKPDEYVGFWEKFEESGKNVLIIKGSNKSTVITNTYNVIPRIDLAKEFYEK